MAKVEINAIVKALETKTDFEKTKIAMLVDEIRSLSEQLAEEEKAERPPKFKKKLMAIRAAVADGVTISEFVFKVPECMEPEELFAAISAAAFDYNDNQKIEARKVRNIIEAVTYLKPKCFKPYYIQLLTKEELALEDTPIEFVDRLDTEAFMKKMAASVEDKTKVTEQDATATAVSPKVKEIE